MSFVQQVLGADGHALWADPEWRRQPHLLVGAAENLRARLEVDKIAAVVAAAARDGGRHFLVVRAGAGDRETADELRRALAQRVPSYDELLELARTATLRITGIAKYHDPCMQLLREVFDGFGERASVNMYLSPAGSDPGLPLHYDDHEIFAVQVAGSKRWSLWTPKPDHLAEAFAAFTGEVPDGATPADMEFEVAQGDVLYVPRGFWHRARCTETASVHLACGVHAKIGTDVVSWLFDEAIKHPTLRENLPPRADITGPTEYDGQLRATEEAVAALREILNAPDAAKRFLRARFRFEHERTFTFDGRT